MRRTAPHQRVLELIRSLDRVDVQNRLLRTSDKEIALSLIYMSDWQQDFVLEFLGTVKEARVRQELERYRHTRILYRQYEMAVHTVIRSLEGGRLTGARVYYRPLRSRATRVDR